MKCAINDCPDEAVGLMSWPGIDTAVNLCQRHADYVGALEEFLWPSAPAKALSIGFAPSSAPSSDEPASQDP